MFTWLEVWPWWSVGGTSLLHTVFSHFFRKALAEPGSEARRATRNGSSTGPISPVEVHVLCHLSMCLLACSTPGSLSFCPHCLSVVTKGKTIRLVPACCTHFCRSPPTSCLSVNLPEICLRITLIAADSLAPGLYFMMSE